MLRTWWIFTFGFGQEHGGMRADGIDKVGK